MGWPSRPRSPDNFDVRTSNVVVLVVQAGKTPRDVSLGAGTHLRNVGAKILGALINKVDLQKSEYSYYYRHYYDTSYYESSVSAQAS